MEGNKMAKNLEEMTPDIRSANRLSIVDYARKNGLPIAYEDQWVAITRNPVNDNEIRIDKENNAWFEMDSNGQEITHGNTVRFAIMHMNKMDLELTEEDWTEVKNNLISSNVSYLDRESYNKKYTSEQADKAQIHPVIQEENKEKNNIPVSEFNSNYRTGQGGDYEQAWSVPSQQKDNPSQLGVPPQLRQFPQGQIGYPGRRTFTKEQMAEILAGIKRGINVAPYDNLLLRPDQMRQIRLSIQEGLDPKPFNYHFVPADYMKEVRLAMRNGADISLLEVTKDTSYIFSGDQAREIRKGLENGLSVEDVKSYTMPYLSSDAMKDMRLGLQDGFEQMKNLNTGNYSAKDIHNIRITLTINKLLESIMVHARALFDKILDLFRKVIESNLYQTDMEEEMVSSPEKAAYHEMKETVEHMYS
jgi:hypothetical protein